MKFENVSRQNSSRLIVVDFQMNNVHTGRYVRQSREKANLVIGRGSTTSHDHQGLSTHFNQGDGTRDGFSYC
jgi:hypothetical protein